MQTMRVQFIGKFMPRMLDRDVGFRRETSLRGDIFWRSAFSKSFEYIMDLSETQEIDLSLGFSLFKSSPTFPFASSQLQAVSEACKLTPYFDRIRYMLAPI